MAGQDFDFGSLKELKIPQYRKEYCKPAVVKKAKAAIIFTDYKMTGKEVIKSEETTKTTGKEVTKSEETTESSTKKIENTTKIEGKVPLLGGVENETTLGYESTDSKTTGKLGIEHKEINPDISRDENGDALESHPDLNE